MITSNLLREGKSKRKDEVGRAKTANPFTGNQCNRQTNSSCKTIPRVWLGVRKLEINCTQGMVWHRPYPGYSLAIIYVRQTKP